MLRTKKTATVNRNGWSKLLAPGAVIATLIATGIFVMNGCNKAVENAKEKGADSMKSMVDGAKEKAGDIANQAKDAIPPLPGVDAVQSSVTELMDGLFASLDSIKDSAGADVALPALKEMASKLDVIGPSLGALPNDPRTMIGGLVRSQMDKLNPLFERVSALPGIGDAVKQILQQLKTKLASFVS